MLKTLSITQKYMLLLVPMIVMGLVVSITTWKALNLGTRDLVNANRLNQLALKSQYYATDMEDKMKAFLLDPLNEGHWRAKEASDEANVRIITEMKTLTTDPELLKIFTEQTEFDEKQLNSKEQEITALLRTEKFQEARHVYVKTLIPAQLLYNELSQKLVDKTEAETARQIAAVNEKMRSSTWTIISTLLVSLLLVSLGLVWTTSRTGRSLVQVVNQLREGASNLETASKEISSASSDLAASATEQAAAIQETVSSIDEINATVAKNSDSAKQGKGYSETSAETASKGKNVVGAMINSIDEISRTNEAVLRQVAVSNREISEIVKTINDIGTKTKIINDIVFQTKLLAFNASVEAARAGEHGKGFAVVAEEVGILARKSGGAAQEIAQMLEMSISKVEKTINETTAKVAQLVENAKEKVEAGTRVAKSCGEVLDEIVSQVNQTKNMVAGIATASDEQSHGVTEISKAMSQLDQATHQNAATSRQCSVSSEKLTEEATQVRKVVSSLVRLVEGESSVSKAS